MGLEISKKILSDQMFKVTFQQYLDVLYVVDLFLGDRNLISNNVCEKSPARDAYCFVPCIKLQNYLCTGGWRR